MYKDVLFLTSLQPARNYQNKASLHAASRYIHDELAALPFDNVQFQEFKVRSGEVYQNISAVLEGERRERIIIGAHYDVCGNQPGADDNASAVAGMLETARLLLHYLQGKKLGYTFEFVGFCLEEPPFFATAEMGSAVHARSMHEQKIPVKLMVSYEMIGFFSDAPGSQGFPHPSLKELFPDAGNFIVVAGNSAQKATCESLSKRMQPHCQIGVYPVAFGMTDGLVDLSDHRNYWKYGYPAVMINDTSFLRNPHYHQTTDTIDTLNFEKMAQVVNGALGAFIGLGNEGLTSDD